MSKEPKTQILWGKGIKQESDPKELENLIQKVLSSNEDSKRVSER